MNTQPSEDLTDLNDPALIEAVVTKCRLSQDVVASINEAMRGLNLPFVDAAIHIGVVGPDEVEGVKASLTRFERRSGTSLVETVLHRRTASRALALRHLTSVVPGPRLLLAHQPDSNRSEHIRALRTELLLQSEAEGRMSMLAMLSPCAAEGRSQLAGELAIAFAQIGKRTLLVDGDLRNPNQHSLFEAPNERGFAQTLSSGEQPLYHGVEGIPFLSLMTSGTRLPNPLEVLSGGRLGQMIGDWRLDYDFVIIDTPPVTQFSDGLVLATMAGSVLTISRNAHTPYSQMNAMLRRLVTTRCRVLGAVINNF
jgi:protein-tyrosine kinase